MFKASQVVQVPKRVFEKMYSLEMKQLTFTVYYVLTKPVSIFVPELHISSLRLVGFFDASFSNNIDHTTQPACIVFAVNKNDLSVPIHFGSYKARRVVWTVSRDELITLSNIIDHLLALSNGLRIYCPRNHFSISLLINTK